MSRCHQPIVYPENILDTYFKTLSEKLAPGKLTFFTYQIFEKGTPERDKKDCYSLFRHFYDRYFTRNNLEFLYLIKFMTESQSG